MVTWRKGSELTPEVKAECLRLFVHRHTRDHKPLWAGAGRYSPQFASDQDWLCHTEFAVTKSGRLNRAVRYCRSHPTLSQRTPPGCPRIAEWDLPPVGQT